MTNDLKNFLEEEREGLFGAMLMSQGLPFSERKSTITTHDTRLINFVLDLMEKEVGEIRPIYLTPTKDNVIIGTLSKKDISTIIANLRV